MPYYTCQNIHQSKRSISGTTIVVHSRTTKGVDMAHEIKPQPQFFQMMMGQHWLVPNKLSDQPKILSKRCYGIYAIKNYSMEFSTDC